jgi:protein-S-isoprenylcysteine O-methyltransferase Ste14
MNDDLFFRPIFVAGFVTVILIIGYRRIQSQATGETLDRLQEGVFTLVALRLAGLVHWSAVIAYMINPSWMAWASVPVPVWVRWGGVGICVAAIVLVTWTLRGLGRNLTDTVVTRRAATLVTHGAYRWVRHPFYGCMTLLIVGNALTAANWFMLLSGIVVLALIVARTRTEEEKLVARFGDAYLAYMAQTGRFVPRFTGRS